MSLEFWDAGMDAEGFIGGEVWGWDTHPTG